MKLGLLLPIGLLCVTPMLAQPALFPELDKNGDGVLAGPEIAGLNPEGIDEADGDIDRCLTEKEYGAYVSFEKKVLTERKNLPPSVKAYIDLPYVENGHYRQKLDIYLPDTAKAGDKLPLVIWIHGGGWRKGNKASVSRQMFLLENGFALASVNYRLSHHDKFPAQIHDCKAAIRYLKKHAAEYGIDNKRIGVWGSSAGGHLVALVGTSGDVSKLEGNLGVKDVSSKVDAVCDFFGPTDFSKLVDRPPNPNLHTTDPRMQTIPRMLGGLITEKPELARLASPVTHVTKNDPPFLIMHGDKDPLVPLQQSVLFHELLQRTGVTSELIIVPDAGHGFFKDLDYEHPIVEFFKKNLAR